MGPSPISSTSDHRFSPITDDNHAGILWITSILCLIYTTLIITVRLHIKWNMYGADDAAALAATIMQYGQLIPLFVALRDGLGQSEHLLDIASVQDAGKAIFASQIFLILSLSLAKGSVAALMLRLFTRDIKATRRTWLLCNATVGLIAAWCIGSIVAVSVSCSPTGLVHAFERQCDHQANRWRVVTSFNILIEVLLMTLPILFIWPIRIKRYIKFQVVLAFGFRLPIIGFAAAHLYYVSRYTKSNNISKAIIPALVYQQFELFWSLLAATVPTLKAFMRSFNSGFGLDIDLDGYSSPYGSRAYPNGSFPLHSLQNATSVRGVVTSATSRSHSRPRKTGDVGGSLTPKRGLKSQVRTATSVTSDGSQELIIQRDVEWSVRTEDVAKT